MLTFAWYLLKAMLCSGILFGYYWIALRNKKFHVYNRFYLLASVVLSWVIPIIKIEFWKDSMQQPQVIKLLAAVASSNRYIEEAAVTTPFTWNWEMVVLLVFAFISVVFLTNVIVTIVRISLLISRNPKEKWNGIYFVFSNAKGTPFSFFKYIFWNKYIDLKTADGQQILKHELVHVHEKHSTDKMFLNLLLTAGWYNPFMWFICKELNLIHEFIADEKTVQNGDVTAFAAMLLKTAYPRYSFPLINSFFYSPVKRRLLMLTTSKKTSYSYLRRVAILPLLMFTCVLFAFSLKKERMHSSKTMSSYIAMDKNSDETTVDEGQSVQKLANEDFQDTTKKKERKLNGSNDSTIKFSNVTFKDSAGRETQISAEITFSDKDSEMLKKELIILNGQIIIWADLVNIDPSLIKSINVLNGETAIKKFGEEGKNGALEITTISRDKYKAAQLNDLKDQQNYTENQQKYNDEKQNFKDQQDFIGKKQKYQQTYLEKQQKYQTSFDRVFTRVENPPYYPKGMAGFADYINSNMQYPKEAIQNKIEGAVLIQFIINEEGKLTDFKKLSDKGYGLEEEAIRLIKNSGNWKPGVQNGHKVPVQVEQQVIFQLPDKV